MVNIISDYIPPFSPLPNIAPFTYKDGETYLSTLENLRTYVNTTLVDFVNTNISLLSNDFILEIATLINTVNAAIAAENINVANQLASQNTSVNTSITNLTTYVNTQVASIINSSVVVQDAVIQGVFANNASASRLFLDTLYGTKVTQDNINAILSTGRLADVNLQSKYSRKNGINVIEYGAIGNAQFLNTAFTVGGSGTLIVSPASFTIADVGKAIKVNGAGTAGADLVTTIATFISTTSVTLTSVAQVSTSNTYAIWGTDNTTQLQNALTAAQNAKTTLYFNAEQYITTQTLTTTQQFYQPNIIGANAEGTIINGLGTFSIIKFLGGSGRLSNTVISHIKFTGSGCTGIELNACDGINPNHCTFDYLATGILYFNQATGSFTEFCVAENCYFVQTVATAIEYRVGSGNGSFHGSGFRSCKFEQAVTATKPTILIGANSLVYSAPWDGTMFINAITSPIKNNSNNKITVSGKFSFEGNSKVLLLDNASLASVYYQGDVYSWGPGIQLGYNFILIDRVQSNADGYLEYFIKKQTVILTGIVTGTTPISMSLPKGNYIANVTIIGNNYNNNYHLYVYRSLFDASGKVVILAQGQTNNTTGWGDATFAIDSATGKLTITNDNAAFAVQAEITISGVGANGSSMT